MGAKEKGGREGVSLGVPYPPPGRDSGRRGGVEQEEKEAIRQIERCQ